MSELTRSPMVLVLHRYINFVRELAREVAENSLSPVPFTPKVQRKV